MKLYRVVILSRQTAKWEMWTNYASYDEAELAACGLITGGAAAECHIIEIRSDGGRIVAKVSAVKKAGWPHGAAAVQK
ncbi:MAG: hypothetical protein ACREA2_03645, partial [Blastocatellia bacterium]